MLQAQIGLHLIRVEPTTLLTRSLSRCLHDDFSFGGRRRRAAPSLFARPSCFLDGPTNPPVTLERTETYLQISQIRACRECVHVGESPEPFAGTRVVWPAANP